MNDHMTLTELESTCLHCKSCQLSNSRNHVVFGEGNPDADLMFIGEGPGRQEDLTGKPFVGKGGKLLDELLEATQLTRKEIYIANIVKCRPPNNRDPLPEEKEACINYLKYQIYLIKPKIIVCLGRVAATRIIDPNYKITKQHGQWTSRKNVKMTAIFHPAALLRDPSKKEETLEDFYQIKKVYEKIKKD